jgi:hypothetical protein
MSGRGRSSRSCCQAVIDAKAGFGVAERSGHVKVAVVEGKRFTLGPQPPDDRAPFSEAPDRTAMAG